jgi:beta-phosphoglucomutase
MMSHAQRWDGVLFDFDGVLADTEPVHWECWKAILDPFGIHLTWDYYQRYCIGLHDRHLLERLAAENQVDFEAIWREYPRKQELFRSRMEQSPPIPVETATLVRELATQYPLALVSSSARIEVEPAVESAGIRFCFKALVCGKEVENAKPAPDPYLRAAGLLGVQRPLVVEDSDAGVASGKAAGFEVLRVSSAHALSREVRAKLKEG